MSPICASSHIVMSSSHIGIELKLWGVEWNETIFSSKFIWPCMMVVTGGITEKVEIISFFFILFFFFGMSLRMVVGHPQFIDNFTTQRYVKEIMEPHLLICTGTLKNPGSNRIMRVTLMYFQISYMTLLLRITIFLDL